MVEDQDEQKDTVDGADLSHVLRELSIATDAVVQRDAATREQVKTLANRLLEEARRAHVYAATSNFDLVEDTYGQGHGVYGYLAVGPHGFHLATRAEWEDITEHSLAPDGAELYSVLALENWPVEWLRLIVERNLMHQLAQCLLTAIQDQIADPKKNAALPPDMQQPSPGVVAIAAQLKFAKVIDVWRETQRELVANPTGALRAACVLLETVCKHILHERRVPLPSTPTLPNLYKAAEKELKMDDDERTLATGLRAVVDGIAHGRSHRSNAHGAGPQDLAPSGSHAELAVTASGALAVHFMKLLSERLKSTTNG
ncbi:abortive infection family protein [Sorangium sp. So ce1151]|uniref:abortive infection family protein n=1 Tax=Sorangium sp. So ce1151 TaxID=3133332 RepID=UPI003F5F5C7B